MEATKAEWGRRGFRLKKDAKPSNSYHGLWGWFDLYDDICVEPKKPRSEKQRENDDRLGKYAKLEAEKIWYLWKGFHLR